jgi:hypothetical protein
MPDYGSQIKLLRIPLDQNYKEVSVLYVYDPASNSMSPVSSVPFEGANALNVNIVGGLLQTENLHVTSDAVIAKSKASIETTNGWQSINLITNKSLRKTIVIKNTGASNILMKIAASIDDEEWDIPLLEETVLEPNKQANIYNDKYYTSISVFVKNAITNNSSTAIVKFAGIAA